MMKKIYLLLPLAMLTTLAMGQIDYTFMVDMNGETVSADGVHVAGNFQEASGEAGDWDPATSAMSDDDMDGIYELTVSIPAGGYEYKFINGNSWDGAEGVPEVSQVGFGNGNRYFQLTAASSNTNGAVQFGGSAPEGMLAVKIQVGLLNGPDETGAHAAGTLFMPNWTPNATALYNISGNVYAVTYNVADIDSTYSYKFLTGDDWGSDETGIPDSCNTDGNRTLTIAGNDTIVPVVCFNSCGPCQASYITFKVDMNLACIDLSTEVVNLMGTVTNWGDGEPMSDDDQDGIWELELPVQSGEWAYKFRVGGGNWEGYPGDRLITVETGVDSVLAPVCWGSADVCSSDAFGPSDITFTVNLIDSTLESDQYAWLMGDFTTPSWQGGAIQMDDNGDGTWSTTVSDFCPQEGRYKFAFGNMPDSAGWTEENAEFQQDGGCGEDNGDFPDNRVLVRTSEEPMTICYTFNTCTACLVGVEELESLNRTSIYPNPATDVINIVFDKNGEYLVRIMDISGKTVYTNQVNADRMILSGNEMVSGVYFVQISDNLNNTITKKLVVK
jgi:hypothetical protein